MSPSVALALLGIVVWLVRRGDRSQPQTPAAPATPESPAEPQEAPIVAQAPMPVPPMPVPAPFPVQYPGAPVWKDPTL